MLIFRNAFERIRCFYNKIDYNKTVSYRNCYTLLREGLVVARSCFIMEAVNGAICLLIHKT